MDRPTQSPDGRYLPDDIPPAQLLRELQPRAKLIIILADPVKRMYSDYYFLDDSLRPVQPGHNIAHSSDSSVTLQLLSLHQQGLALIRALRISIIELSSRSRSSTHASTCISPAWRSTLQSIAPYRRAGTTRYPSGSALPKCEIVLPSGSLAATFVAL